MHCCYSSSVRMLVVLYSIHCFEHVCCTEELIRSLGFYQASSIILSCSSNLFFHSGSILSRLSGHSSCKPGFVQSGSMSECPGFPYTSSPSPQFLKWRKVPGSSLVMQPFSRGNWNSDDRDRGVNTQTVRDRKEIFGNTTH